jgi:glycine cleavage system pyridoxal-binding protein P
MPTCYEYKTNVGEPKMSEEQPQPQQPVKRKRRSRAEMAALRAEKAAKTVKVENVEAIKDIEKDFKEMKETPANPVALVLVEEPVGSGSFVDCSAASVADLVCYKAEGRKVITTLQWYVM